MLSIPIITQWQWHIRTPHVYRYLPEEFVDGFFATGRIRLSSFAQFAKYPDEEKGDDKEGRNILVGIGTRSTVFAATGHGYNAYILCGTTLLSQELMSGFGGTAAIEIKDTTAFGIAIAQKLTGLVGAMEGFCYYHDGPIESDIGDFDFEQLKQDGEGKNMSMDKLQALVSRLATQDVFFRKRLKYEHQGEYRLIWMMNKEISDALIVECPEAREFCIKQTLRSQTPAIAS